jgi:AhpD family alkylhydroperoxidase
MRLQYTPNPPEFTNPEHQEILSRVLARRGGQLVPLDRTLLHAQSVTAGFGAFVVAIRTQTSLPDDVREMIFCRVAALNKCWYEWDIHAPLALAAGLGEDALRAVREAEPANGNKDRDGLNDCQRAVMAFADAIALNGRIPDEVFRSVKEYFGGSQEMVELVATVTGFIMVSKFCVALEVGETATDD